MDSNPPHYLHYHVGPDPRCHARYVITDDRAGLVDSVSSLRIAMHEARLLNAGLAVVHPHALLGCRVEPLRHVA